MVVDLAVLERDHLAVAAEERLRPRLEIDDREPPHRHADGAVQVLAFTVRATMDHHVAHGGQQSRRDAAGDRVDDARDAAHQRGVPVNHASRKTSAYAATIASKSFNRSSTWRLLSASRCRTSGSRTSRSRCAANAAASPGVYHRALTFSRTCSLTPYTGVVTIGSPAAMASRITRGKLSTREVSTKRSLAV